MAHQPANETMFKLLALFAVLSLCSVNLCHAQTATIAVASNFKPTMEKLAQSFSTSHGHQLRRVYGSSGKLLAQIRHGAPFDAFLSADTAKPQHLISQGLGIMSSSYIYAIGQLALWSPSAKTPLTAAILKQPDITLAIANPKLAPYGVAATQLLATLQLTNASNIRLIQGENINQTFQFVATGNADVGLVAYSQLTHHSQNIANAWRIPPSSHAPIEQQAILLRSGQSNSAASDFLAYLASTEAKAIIRWSGYRVVD
jgi:molybdate transport system substrate-binding protein